MYMHDSLRLNLIIYGCGFNLHIYKSVVGSSLSCRNEVINGPSGSLLSTLSARMGC